MQPQKLRHQFLCEEGSQSSRNRHPSTEANEWPDHKNRQRKSHSSVCECQDRYRAAPTFEWLACPANEEDQARKQTTSPLLGFCREDIRWPQRCELLRGLERR